MACRADATSVIRVACRIGRSTASLMAVATGRYGMSGVPAGGMALASPASVERAGPATFRKSRRPEEARLTAISQHSSRSRPPTRSSSPIIRKPTSKRSPTDPRTASRTSKVNRRRLAMLPPYSSVRRFTNGVQNWSSRWLVASNSIPSRPASAARRAAEAKSVTTRRISERSISLGQKRCMGSRIGDGAIVGSQSPSLETLRRPIWVSWHMIAVPCPWIRSTMSARGATMESDPKSS